METLTLNDFRRVLGKVNDGDVVFNAERTGLKKVNYGRIFTHEKTVGDAETNKRIRQLFYDAVVGSVECRGLKPATLAWIRAQLGIDDNGRATGTALLNRRTVKAVLDRVDSNDLAFREGMLVPNECRQLANLLPASERPFLTAAMAAMNDPRFFRDPETMAGLLPPEGFSGRSAQELARFAKDNHRALEVLVLGHLYKAARDLAGEPLDRTQVGAAFRAAVEQLMGAYAKGETPCVFSDVLVKSAPLTFRNENERTQFFDRYKRVGGDDYEASLVQLKQLAADAKIPSDQALLFDWAMDFLRSEFRNAVNSPNVGDDALAAQAANMLKWVEDISLLRLVAGASPKMLLDLVKKVTDGLVGQAKGGGRPTQQAVLQTLQGTFFELFGKFSLQNLVRTALAGGHPLPGMNFDQTVDHIYEEVRGRCWTKGDVRSQDAMRQAFGNAIGEAYAATHPDAPVAAVPGDFKVYVDSLVTNRYDTVLAAPKLPKKLMAPEEPEAMKRYESVGVANFENTVERLARHLDRLKELENGLDPNRAMLLQRALDIFVKDFRDAYNESSGRLPELQRLAADLSDYLGILDVLEKRDDKDGIDREVRRLTQLADEIVAAAGGLGKSVPAESSSATLRDCFDEIVGPLLKAGSLRAALSALLENELSQVDPTIRKLLGDGTRAAFVNEQMYDIYVHFVQGKAEDGNVFVPHALKDEVLKSQDEPFKDLLEKPDAVTVRFDDELVKASYARCGGDAIDSAIDGLRDLFGAYRSGHRHETLDRALEQVRTDFRTRFNANVGIIKDKGVILKEKCDWMVKNHSQDVKLGQELARIADEIETVREHVSVGMKYALVNSLTDDIRQAVKSGNAGVQAIVEVLKKGLGDFTSKFSLPTIVRTALAGSELPEGGDLDVWTGKLVGWLTRKTQTGTLQERKAAGEHIREQLVYAFEHGGEAGSVVQDDFKAELLAACRDIAAAEAAAKEKRKNDETNVITLARRAGELRIGGNVHSQELEGLQILAKMIHGSAFASLPKEELIDLLVAAGSERLDFAMSCVLAGVDIADKAIASTLKRPGVTPIRDLLLDSGIDPKTLTSGAVYTLSQILGSCLSGSTLRIDSLFGNYQNDTSSKLAMHNLVVGAIAAAGIDRSAELLQNGVMTKSFDINAYAAKMRIEIGDMSLSADMFVDTFMSSYPEQLKDIPPVTQIDVSEFLATFSRMGIGLDQFGTFEGRERIATLLFMAAKNPTGLVGLSEFCQRLTGKTPAEVRLVDYAKTFLRPSGAVPDPAEKLGPVATRVADVLMGKRNLSEAQLTLVEKVNLLDVAKRLQTAQSGFSTKVALRGQAVTLTALGGGRLTMSVNGCILPVGDTAAGLVHKAEDEIFAEIGPRPENRAGNKKALELLPPLPTSENGISVMRARELYCKALSLSKGIPVVSLATVTLAELRRMAVVALSGTDSGGLTVSQLDARLGELMKTPPSTYVSTDVIEARQHLERDKENDVDVDSIVKIRTKAPPRLVSERQGLTRPEDVRNLAADMLLNADTWQIDETTLGMAGQSHLQGGERLRRLLLSYGPELKNIRANEALLDELPEIVRAEMRDIILEAARIDLHDLGSEKKLAELETKLENLAGKAMETLQAKVTEMFPGNAGDERKVWQKSFGEITGADGLDVSTPSGAFAVQVLHGYFTNSRMMDKRKMLAAVIRQDYSDVKPQNRDAMLVAELLKGAGPLLQKILQGLPAESFNRETQLALKDMKSRLPSIPEDAVQAQLYELVKCSGGRILSIEVKKSLGAASVGQAFLCNVKTPDHPVIGVDCVIKVLRPNAQTSICREKALIDKLVKSNAAQARMFGLQFANILRELDFTLEAANVDLGEISYEQPYVPAETSTSQDEAFSLTSLMSAVGRKMFGSSAAPLDEPPENSVFQPKIVYEDVANRKYSDVHSMKRLEGLSATTGALVVRRAPGRTVDGMIREMNEELEARRKSGFSDVSGALDIDGGGFQRRFETRDPGTYFSYQKFLHDQRAELLVCRKAIENVVDAWLDRALFGDGFFHGDLHEGNVMFDGKGITLIDYGNCSRLTLHEQNLLQMLMVQAMNGDSVGFGKVLAKEFGRAIKMPAALNVDLNEVLNKGTPNDALSRLHGALAVLQKHGVTLSGNINAFIQSFIRLNGVVTAIDDEFMELEDYASSVHFTGDWLDLNPGEGIGSETNAMVALFKALKDAMSLELPITSAKVDEVFRGFQEIRAAGTFGKDFEELAERLGSDQMKAVVDKLEKLQTDLGLSVENGKAFFDGARKFLSLEKNAADYGVQRKRCLSLINSGSGLSSLVDNFKVAFCKLDPELTKDMNFVPTLQEMRPFEDIVASTVSHRTIRMAQVLFNVFDGSDEIRSSAGKLGASRTLAGKIARGVQSVKNTEKALPPLTKLHVEKAAKDFCAPAKRPYREPNWARNAEDRKTVFEIIRGDLARLRKAVGGKPTKAMIRYAFDLNDWYECESEVTNAKKTTWKASGLAAAMRNLPDNDYNQLLSEAQAGNDPDLVACLGVLRQPVATS